MDDQWIAIIGGILAGLVLRLSNMVIQWVAKVLGVNPPEPIPVDGQAVTDPPSAPTHPPAA